MVEKFKPLPSILILGHGEHGKGTASEILAGAYGHTHLSSSAFAFPRIYPILRAARGYKNQRAALKDKNKERTLWKEAITLLNSPDRSTLARLILQQASIYDGMRCHKEYQAARHLFDHIIWIDAKERKPKDPSMTIKFDPDVMLYVDNNGPEQALVDQLCKVYDTHIWS